MNYFGQTSGGFETLGLEGLGLDQYSAISPLPDVSRGGEDMQGSYPGTSDGGAGFNLNTLFGGLNKVLDYAIIRDQQKLQYSPERLVYAQQLGQVQTQQAVVQDAGGFIKLLLIGGVVLFVMSNQGGGSK